MKKAPAVEQSQDKVDAALSRDVERAKDYQSFARYLDLHTAAIYVGLSFWTLREFIIAGKIQSVRLPHPTAPGKFLRRILVDRFALDRFMEENSVGERSLRLAR